MPADPHPHVPKHSSRILGYAQRRYFVYTQTPHSVNHIRLHTPYFQSSYSSKHSKLNCKEPRSTIAVAHVPSKAMRHHERSRTACDGSLNVVTVRSFSLPNNGVTVDREMDEGIKAGGCAHDTSPFIDLPPFRSLLLLRLLSAFAHIKYREGACCGRGCSDYVPSFLLWGWNGSSLLIDKLDRGGFGRTRVSPTCTRPIPPEDSLHPHPTTTSNMLSLSL
ncbi:hypothetical protein WG66_008901 [Moniliophthora roreri]|nr:hypothetical protein WG66_008901 [Moniliophthora roreri]